MAAVSLEIFKGIILSISSGQKSNQRIAGRVLIATGCLHLTVSKLLAALSQTTFCHPVLIVTTYLPRSQNFEKLLLVWSCLSVRLSDWNNWGTDGRILMKFYI